jgi:hypothetical protein
MLELPREEAAGSWCARFGVALSAFDDYCFWARVPHTTWIAHREAAPPEGVHPDSVGIAFLRLLSHYPKPTSAGIWRFGHLATQNLIDLDDAQALSFLRRGRFALDAPPRVRDEGYVIARHDGVQLGCGLWVGGFLSSQLPKGNTLDPDAPLYGGIVRRDLLF